MQGYEVFTAENGKEAMTIYKNNPVDIVITDILMPEKDGEEMILEMKNSNPAVKIIAISGGGILNANDTLNIVEFLDVDYTFSKPVKKEVLLKAINDILKK